jgi:hypothetical protein
VEIAGLYLLVLDGSFVFATALLRPAGFSIHGAVLPLDGRMAVSSARR